MTDCIDAIHAFWFGELDPDGLCEASRHSLWFSRDDTSDTIIRERFGPWLALALAGELDDWSATDRGLVALVVLLDQFSRNIHRDSPAAFAGDARARGLACAAIDGDRHLRLPTIHRVFLYLPLEHSEDLDDQQRCVALFTQLETHSGRPEVKEFSRYARAHRDVIARFGRFPHRNATLGRTSTPEELAHLAQHGGF